MVREGSSRREIAQSLNAAYADGLLSEDTFVRRVEQLLTRRLIDPRSLIGDLSFRSRRGFKDWAGQLRSTLGRWWTGRRRERELLLALDWTGGQNELLIGRHHACDVVLADPSVSRRHARMVFRDGSWVLQDLESMNGTRVNGAAVGRCVLWPGDHLALGSERLRID